MVLISHIYKFIYIKNSKVAGTSVESFFDQFCVDPNQKHIFKHSTTIVKSKFGIIGSRLRNGKIWQNHMSATDIKKHKEKEFDTYLKFCVVRNPYDTAVSKYFWRNQNKRYKSFKEYIKKSFICEPSQFKRYSINRKSVCDYHIRYEHLHEDIVELCKILNITNYDLKDLPNFKSGFRDKSKHYSQFYDDETKKLVYEKCKEEFELFNYTFENNL